MECRFQGQLQELRIKHIILLIFVWKLLLTKANSLTIGNSLHNGIPSAKEILLTKGNNI